MLRVPCGSIRNPYNLEADIRAEERRQPGASWWTELPRKLGLVTEN